MIRWTAHLNRGPRRSYHAAVIVENKVFSFGGEDSNDSDHTEVHVFNTVSLCWMKLSPVTPGRGERSLEVPPSRRYHTAVLIESVSFLPLCIEWTIKAIVAAYTFINNSSQHRT